MISVKKEIKNLDEKWCSGCKKQPKDAPIILTIQGNSNCYYCGNQISMCEDCWTDFIQKIYEYCDGKFLGKDIKGEL